MKRPTLAVCASMPGRPLEAAVRSMRPQVDELFVYLNGYEEVPQFLLDLDCDVFHGTTNRGAEMKFWLTDSWTDHYLTFDDDFAYPADYVERLTDEVLRWRGEAAVGVLGRRYLGTIRGWQNSAFRAPHKVARSRGAWVNLLGTGTLAFDAGKLNVPCWWAMKNCLDPQFAVWAQQHKVPMWCIPRPQAWLTVLQEPGPGSVFQTDREEGFTRRNTVMTSWPDWKIHYPSCDPDPNIVASPYDAHVSSVPRGRRAVAGRTAQRLPTTRPPGGKDHHRTPRLPIIWSAEDRGGDQGGAEGTVAPGETDLVPRPETPRREL